MSQPSDLVTVTQKRYQCRHVHADGRQCGSPALRTEQFCYHHHTTRRPKPAAGKSRFLDVHQSFELPVVEDFPSALSVAAQILCRIASNDLDHERSGRLLSNLKIITSIIDKASRAGAPSVPASSGRVGSADPKPEPLEELVNDEAHGLIAPITEYQPMAAGAPSVPALSGRVGSSSGRVESATPPPERDYTPEEQDYFKNTISPRGYEPYSQFLRPTSITEEDIQIRADACRRARGFPPLTPCKDATGRLIVHELGLRYTTPLIALRAAINRPQPGSIPNLKATAEHGPAVKSGAEKSAALKPSA